MAIRERRDIVYREPARSLEPAGPRQPSPATYTPDLVREVEATTTLLFRYSAMTFNGHRFHYDLPYATEVEGYPGLVVHGPLQASLLLNLSTTSLGKVPRIFRYRGASPLIAGQVFKVAGRSEHESFDGETTDASGVACMTATANL